jgi:hypothetical protein
LTANELPHIVGSERPRQVGDGPEPHGFGHASIPEGVSQHHDRHVGVRFADLLEGIQAVAVVEVEPEQHPLRILDFELSQRLSGVGHLQRLEAK